MSSPIPQRKRRADIEDDGEADSLRDSQRSTPFSDSAKRARTNGYQGSESPDPEDSDTDNSPRLNGHTNRGGPANENHNAAGPGEFQPGAIVRVKVTNFVTYENAEFFPGPNLNMVIGPNGTGKSSLVCAICLGLGWGAKHLGRAGEVGEFVKHGMSDAHIEIELQRRRNEPLNHVVRSRIIRDGNSREWWLNNKKTSLKAVQELTRSLSIQIDNLCQFLPQDKVSEFAALTPVELLQQTQRAAAPEEMLDWHNELKKYRKEQKDLEIQNTNDKEQLEGLQARQDGLRAEVRRLEERKEIQEQVAFLKKSRPFVEYRHAVNEHRAFKARKKAAQERLKRLEARLGPTLQSIERKKQLARQTEAIMNERKKALLMAEKAADKCSSEIEAKEGEIQEIETKISAEKKSDKDIRTNLAQLERKLADLKVKANAEPIVFDAAEYNDRVVSFNISQFGKYLTNVYQRAKEHEKRDIENEIQDLKMKNKDLTVKGKAIRDQKDEAEQQLAAFDTQEGQQMNKLERLSRDTATAWKWVQENMEMFEKPVYGPPIISCSLKDQRYADVVEAALARPDFLALTVQTKADHKKLSDQLFGTMKLADVTVRKNDENGVPGHPSISQNDMRNLGFEGWASDFIDGPIPVLSMLCYSARINRTAVGLRDSTEDQHNMIVDNGIINSWITGGTLSRVAKRSEYGAGATSTTTRAVRCGQYWTDQPVDSSAKREIEEKMERLDDEFQKMAAEIKPLREKLKNLDTRSLQKEIVSSFRSHLLCFTDVLTNRNKSSKKKRISREPKASRGLFLRRFVHFP